MPAYRDEDNNGADQDEGASSSRTTSTTSDSYTPSSDMSEEDAGAALAALVSCAADADKVAEWEDHLYEAYDKAGMDCPDVYARVPKIAQAAVDDNLSYKTYICAPESELTDHLLTVAEVPFSQKAAARRLLGALASGSTDGPKSKRKKVQEHRSPEMNAYQSNAREEVARLNPPATFNLEGGKKKTTPAVKKPYKATMAEKGRQAEEVAATVAALIAKHVKPGSDVTEDYITEHFEACWDRYAGINERNGVDKMQTSRAHRFAGTPGSGKRRRRNVADEDDSATPGAVRTPEPRADATPAGGGGGGEPDPRAHATPAGGGGGGGGGAPDPRAHATPAGGGGGGEPDPRARATPAGGGGGGAPEPRADPTPAGATPRRALAGHFGTPDGGGGSPGGDKLGGGGNKYKSAPAFGDGCHASYLATAWGAHLDAAAANLNAANEALSAAERDTTAAKSALEECKSRGKQNVAMVAVKNALAAEEEARDNAAAAAKATKRFTVLMVSTDGFGGADIVGAGTVAADAMSTEPDYDLELRACVEVTFTHIAKRLPPKGVLVWCAPVELPACPPAGCGGLPAAGGGGGARPTDEGSDESGGGIGVCGTREELHDAWEGHKIDKLLWPWAGIALHPPVFKNVTAGEFIASFGDKEFLAAMASAAARRTLAPPALLVLVLPLLLLGCGAAPTRAAAGDYSGTQCAWDPDQPSGPVCDVSPVYIIATLASTVPNAFAQLTLQATAAEVVCNALATEAACAGAQATACAFDATKSPSCTAGADASDEDAFMKLLSCPGALIAAMMPCNWASNDEAACAAAIAAGGNCTWSAASDECLPVAIANMDEAHAYVAYINACGAPGVAMTAESCAALGASCEWVPEIESCTHTPTATLVAAFGLNATTSAAAAAEAACVAQRTAEACAAAGAPVTAAAELVLSALNGSLPLMTAAPSAPVSLLTGSPSVSGGGAAPSNGAAAAAAAAVPLLGAALLAALLL
ncbi:MAG: hypothetical protein J3K34DRAFT_503500 [Monoraphidium minutum]|nr:MAG: hypothetical protein J3K34DRAFT_503500 [Monoraphidium minutum]